MEQPSEFLSPNHKRLLSIATWAKYLAWVVLVFYFFRASLYIPTYQMRLIGIDAFAKSNGIQAFFDFLEKNPYYIATLVSSMLNTFLSGLIFFLLLQSINLGLSMIVETDINYREKKAEGDER